MKRALRNLWLSAISAVVGASLCLSSVVQAAEIQYQMDPEMPEFVRNPGGVLTANCWVIAERSEQTGVLRVALFEDQTNIPILEEEVVATEHTLTWEVPFGTRDGVYRYEVTYTPEGGEAVSLQAGVLLLSATRTLCVYKFIDLDGNGIFDGADYWQPNWEICHDDPLGQHKCAVTGVGGVYCWRYVPSGYFTVCETPQPGYINTTPLCQVVRILGSSTVNVFFGNKPIVGACCYPDGSCVVQGQLDCEANGGIFQGDGTACDPNPCPQPTGACCFPDGHCELLIESECANAGGTWLGLGAPCDPNPCPQPTGACCFYDGHCPNPCPQPTGACCFHDGHCEVLTEEACTQAGGMWLGIDAPCDPNPCEQPLGACCFEDGSCLVLTEAECIEAGGIWQGIDTPCDPNPCPQPLGACCYPDGSCVVSTEDDCLAGGGSYYGDDTVCDPNPCPQPRGACCYEDGTCVVSTEEDCLTGGGTYYGDGTICDPNPCPQPPELGACCLVTGECVILTADDCTAQNGSYQGDDTDCDPNPCPPPVATEKKTWGTIKQQYR
ncbi:MAG: hypothetical protein IPK72_20725 [Candidatus Eisenbacteria bacterium]|nr:hypothetical protein [Candidatus Eisenbacteria bacterium]